MIVSTDVTFDETFLNPQSTFDVNESSMKSVANTDQDMQPTHNDLNEDNHDHESDSKVGGLTTEDYPSSGMSDKGFLTYYPRLHRFESASKATRMVRLSTYASMFDWMCR